MKTQGWISIAGLLIVAVLTWTAPAVAFGQTPEETPGADLFVMPREAVLRDKPKANARIVGRLPAGTLLKLVATGERFLQVDVPVPPEPGGAATGYVAREVTAAFPEGADGTRDLVDLAEHIGVSADEAVETAQKLAAAGLLRIVDG